jgi:hypothetical protein
MVGRIFRARARLLTLTLSPRTAERAFDVGLPGIPAWRRPNHEEQQPPLFASARLAALTAGPLDAVVGGSSDSRS